MLQCHVYGSTEFRETAVDELFQMDGQPVLVESISARVCARCGEAAITLKELRRSRRLWNRR